jgi:formate-dependent nitrite reductase membrane component NrfD
MSLAPMWFSTMFPVYFFAGSVLSGLATIMLIGLLLQKSGRVTDEIRIEHYHDLAKLIFAFIFFWGYIAFSQFMLIWYANMPEETFWFLFRTDRGWLTVSLVLLFGHLFIPFLGLMARTVRRNRTYLLFSAIFLLAMHWVDHYWIVMPQLNASIYPEYNYFENGPLMAGIFVASYFLVAGKNPLVPLHDPRLHEALNYDNP